jgi:hypothetical protein
LPAYSYTAREVGWLRSLSGDEDLRRRLQQRFGISIDRAAFNERMAAAEARALDVESLERTGNWGAGDESGLPVIARLHDVRRAREAVLMRKGGQALARLAAEDLTQREAAHRLGVSQATVSRQMRASNQDVLAELDDPNVDEGATSPPRIWPTLCAACYMGDGNVRLSKAPRVQTPAVRLAATVAERWILAGRMWDASRGRAVQRWHTRQGDVLVPRALSRAQIGAAYDAVFVIDDEQRIERLAFAAAPTPTCRPRDPHIGQWKRATDAAAKGEPPPQMTVLPRVPLPVVEVEPERQTHLCEEHLPEELRPRVIHAHRKLRRAAASRSAEPNAAEDRHASEPVGPSRAPSACDSHL